MYTVIFSIHASSSYKNDNRKTNQIALT